MVYNKPQNVGSRMKDKIALGLLLHLFLRIEAVGKASGLQISGFGV